MLNGCVRYLPRTSLVMRLQQASMSLRQRTTTRSLLVPTSLIGRVFAERFCNTLRSSKRSGSRARTSSSDVMNLIDQADSSSRWRGFGLIFGYPAYAVDFFVKAGEEEKQTGKFVKRDFLHLKTTGGSEGSSCTLCPKDTPFAWKTSNCEMKPTISSAITLLGETCTSIRTSYPHNNFSRLGVSTIRMRIHES